MVAKASVEHTGRLQLDCVRAKRTALKLLVLFLAILRDLLMRSSHYVSGVRPICRSFGMITFQEKKRLLHRCPIAMIGKSCYGHHPAIQIDTRL